jgi:hypothetical protein
MIYINIRFTKNEEIALRGLETVSNGNYFIIFAINTIKKNIEVSLEASREVGLEINTEKTILVLSHQQNAG